ncbi:hypothetical protein DSO57_1021141 [Entomophthora muscae]|nr:hypothetical protein DSO57_1021141 [Entomophthora muscae]
MAKAISISLNDFMVSDEFDDFKLGDDILPPASGIKRSASVVNEKPQSPKQTAIKALPSTKIASTKPTLNQTMVRALNRVKRLKTLPNVSFRVLPISHKISAATKGKLDVVMATEERCSNFTEAASLLFTEKIQYKSVCSLLIESASTHLTVSPDELETLKSNKLVQAFNSWSGPKGNIDMVSELVAFVFRAWQDNHWYEFVEDITKCGARTRFLRFKFYGNLLVRDATEDNENPDRLLPLNLYLTGLSAMDQLGEHKGPKHQAHHAIEAAEELFKELLNDQALSKLLGFWSIAMVALFGRSLCPARMANAEWPSKTIPLFQATELTQEVQDSVVFAIQYLIAVRKGLVKGNRYR